LRRSRVGLGSFCRLSSHSFDRIETLHAVDQQEGFATERIPRFLPEDAISQPPPSEAGRDDDQSRGGLASTRRDRAEADAIEETELDPQ
jgi:hypothetical protein